MIEEKVPYVTRNMKVGVGYKCRDIEQTDQVEIFQEDEIVPTSRNGDEEEYAINRGYLDDEKESGQRVLRSAHRHQRV
jgi:hypothetical protein